MSDATSPTDVFAQSPLRFRRLRIAVSVFFVALAIAFLALCVRSYRKVDRLYIPMDRRLALSSSADIILIAWYAKGVKPRGHPEHVEWLSNDVQEFEANIARLRSWSWKSDSTRIAVSFPIWFATVLSSVVAAIVWHKHRFSLRTLLIATTLVAIALGTVVWMLS